MLIVKTNWKSPQICCGHLSSFTTKFYLLEIFFKAEFFVYYNMARVSYLGSLQSVCPWWLRGNPEPMFDYLLFCCFYMGIFSNSVGKNKSWQYCPLETTTQFNLKMKQYRKMVPVELWLNIALPGLSSLSMWNFSFLANNISFKHMTLQPIFLSLKAIIETLAKGSEPSEI